MSKQEKIKVWVTPETDRKAALPSLAKKASTVVEVGADVLAQKLESFLTSFRPLIDVEKSNTSDFVIDEIELSLAVNASGGIELVGKLEGGAEASLKVKLKRRTSLNRSKEDDHA